MNPSIRPHDGRARPGSGAPTHPARQAMTAGAAGAGSETATAKTGTSAGIDGRNASRTGPIRMRLHAWFGPTAWWRPSARPQHHATHRNVYILPSGAGWLFAALLAVLLIASINDRLALGHALTFGLASVALVSMPITHAQVRGLRLRLQAPAPVAAGTSGALVLDVEHPGPARHGLKLRMAGQTVDLALPADGTSTVHLPLPAAQRGWQTLPALVVESRFPFGLFRAWTVWRPTPARLVWPAAEHPVPAFPTNAQADGQAPATFAHRPQSPGDFNGLRPWRASDGPREIAWKHLARRPEPLEPVSRDMTGRHPTATAGPLWLAWEDAAPPLSASAVPGIAPAAADDADPPRPATVTADIEARLSRLTAWVHAAHDTGRPCGLRLPGCVIAPAWGDAHRHRLLKALALWNG
jgi:uncharacterized protein (DUF58 family)